MSAYVFQWITGRTTSETSVQSEIQFAVRGPVQTIPSSIEWAQQQINREKKKDDANEVCVLNVAWNIHLIRNGVVDSTMINIYPLLTVIWRHIQNKINPFNLLCCIWVIKSKCSHGRSSNTTHSIEILRRLNATIHTSHTFHAKCKTAQLNAKTKSFNTYYKVKSIYLLSDTYYCLSSNRNSNTKKAYTQQLWIDRRFRNFSCE